MKSSVGIITFHRADNYGAVLQTYASLRFLSRNGIPAEVIDYRFPEMEKRYRLFGTGGANSAVRKLKIIAHDSMRILRRMRFEQFRRKHLALSRVFTPETVAQSNELYDTFVTGSDQVWNDTCSLEDPNYALAFADETKRLLSFAASFGYGQVSENRKDFYKEALQRFEGISVREASGVGIVEELTGRTPDLIPDPTLMLSAEEWDRIAVAPRQQKYILVYLLNARDDVLQFAKRLSEKTGLEIVNITDENRNAIGATCVHNAGPLEFLGYFSKAEYVITNSFHGLMFSLIYRRSVYVDIPKGAKTTYERLTHILDSLGICDRYIDSLPEGFVPQKLDYANAESRIQELQEKTQRFVQRYFVK